MKNRIITAVLIILLLTGLSLLLYPSVSNYWNSFHATQAVSNYVQDVQKLDRSWYETMWDDAVAYNKSLLSRSTDFALTDKQERQYSDLLNIDGTGIMGYVEIPAIKLSLPIYHGTEDSVLQIAAGHIEWSSLPTGGASTHCVLSGHRGLPSAKLFTNLDQLVAGDTFAIRVLDEIMTYEVDQILIVEPEDVSALTIEDGKDLCTLVTCTPYGVNTHRLLVRGHRVENRPETARVTSDAIQIEPLIVAPLVALPVLLALLIVLLLSGMKRPARGRKNAKNKGNSE